MQWPTINRADFFVKGSRSLRSLAVTGINEWVHSVDITHRLSLTKLLAATYSSCATFATMCAFLSDERLHKACSVCCVTHSEEQIIRVDSQAAVDRNLFSLTHLGKRAVSII